MASGSGEYDGTDGRRHYRWWSADAPRWAVLFSHGFGDHSGRQRRLAEAIVASGGAMFAPDIRGHGLSEGERAVVKDFEDVATDFLQVMELPPFPEGLPVVLAGQSLGGLVATCAALRGRSGVAGLAASGARLGGWEAAEAVLESIDRGVDPATLGSQHPLLDPAVKLPPDALCRDPSMFEQFANDTLTYRGTYPLDTLRAYVEATRRLARHESALAMPVLYLHGGADPITPYRPSVRRILALAGEDLQIRIFPGARHSIYNEINREEVIGVLRGFVERAVGVASATAGS